MAELSLQALWEMLQRTATQGGANFGTTSSLEDAQMPLSVLDRGARAVGEGIAQTVATPGRLMAPNPWPEGTEQWHWYEASKRDAATRWAPEMALNTMGTGGIVGVPVRGGEAVLGAGAVRKAKPKEIPTENNPGLHNDRPFWSGMFDPRDGHIIETHPYQKAEKADFHHSHYFSNKALEAEKEGNAHFFWMGKDGKIQTEWREAEAKPNIVRAIESQLGNKAKSGTDLGNKAGTSDLISAPYIQNPVRVANPGVYKRPDVIAAEAAARVEPEHPALKDLFGVTRQDLYDINQQGRRQGNVTESGLWAPTKAGGKVNEAAAAVMNPANEQRILDTLSEARRHPGLEQGMVPWYVMDPLYQRMEKLVGPERAAKEYRDFNMSMTPFSAGSSVPSEINRGTAANMMRMRGEYPIFQQYGGIAVPKRGADFPEILRDVKGMMGHGNQANPVARYMETGQHGYGDANVKINLYSGASGVPETGFQTRWAVPDAHFTRALGVPDARANPNNFNEYMIGTEYRPIGPWYREKIAEPLGIEAVPAQALMWGTYGPQTGVKTKIGAGKLELLSKQMWERAQKLGIDPQTFRDQVLRGEQHSELEDPNMGLARLQNYA